MSLLSKDDSKQIITRIYKFKPDLRYLGVPKCKYLATKEEAIQFLKTRYESKIILGGKLYDQNGRLFASIGEPFQCEGCELCGKN